MSTVSPILEALDQRGYRITAPRRAVADLISRRRGHFSAADLETDARARRVGIGRATIFRALDLFEELNVVERLDLPSGEHAYIACEPAHHHHVVCSACGRTAEVEDSGLREVTREMGRRTGYKIDTHRLELYGLCPECRRAGANG